jgi:glycosyltransferase involved in cell wall biosynthesis
MDSSASLDSDAHKTSGAFPPAGLFLMIDSLQTGGSERQFVALKRSIDQKRFRVSLGCIQAKGAFLEGLNVTSFPLGGSLYGPQSWKTRLNLGRHLRRHKIAIAHAFDFYTNLTLIPAARLARIPVVIGSQRQLGDLLTPMQSRAQTFMFRHCDAVVCNSSAAAKRLVSDGVGEGKIAVIWNGLPVEAFSPAVPALPRQSGLRRVGMIARMNSRAKNHSLFLRAIARMRDSTQVEFVVIGDGPLRPTLEREAADLGLAGRVCFLGDRRDIPAILASLDLTVLSSDSESLSNAVIESMAAGIPAIATDVGANSELLTEDRGILVPVGDENRLALAMEHLLKQDNLRVQMGEACRSFALENFTVEQMRRRYEDLYTELLERKNQPTRLKSLKA